MRRIIFFAIASCLSLSVPATSQERISCMAWCGKCMPGNDACSKNCAERSQPRVNPSCEVRHRPDSQSYAIKGAETVELQSVYWLGGNCKSSLKSFGGIDILSGPPQVTLALKEQMVQAMRQNCSHPVKGAVVMATGKGITAQLSSELTFRVRYNTIDGPRQSVHTVKLQLYP